jgi:hypothetical protein
MSRAAAMLLLRTLALVPSTSGAGDTFSCKDAEGTLVIGNVDQHRCVGRVTKATGGSTTLPLAMVPLKLRITASQRPRSTSGGW